MRTLVELGGKTSDASPAALERRLAAGDERGFWLDIEAPEEEDYEILQDVFHFHHLTVEDVRQQNQRPKVDRFGDYAFAVLFTTDRDARTGSVAFHEHHLYLGRAWLISVHHEPAPFLDDLRRQFL